MTVFKRIAKALKRAMKRFLGDKPKNKYERIVFKAFRDTAVAFGGTA